MSDVVFELAGATVRYGGAAAAQLVEATFAVRAGECVAIVGPNGAGKTTALRAMLGVAPLVAGRALVLGRDVHTWDRRALARDIAAVGQREEPVFPITVAETVAMGRYPHLGPWKRQGAADDAAIARAMARADVGGLPSAGCRHCPAASGSGCGWPGPWPRSPAAWCSMNPPRRSTCATRWSCSS